jgi:molybdopterin synthase catalytic subunit
MVRVRFFAGYREQLGREEVLLELEEEVTLGELLERLGQKLPGLDRILGEGRAIIAVNHEVASKESLVAPGDEVAIFPPVSGGDEKSVRVQRGDFSVGEEVDRMRRCSTRTGAVVAFLGTVREFSRGKHIRKLQYEHYPGMAEKKLVELRDEALEKFDILDLRIIHRTGELRVNENIVLILASAEHRRDAFRACRWCIDELKRRVPIWKKEVATDGEVWVEEHP